MNIRLKTGIIPLTVLVFQYFTSGFLCAQTGPLRFADPFKPQQNDSVFFRITAGIPDSGIVSFAVFRFCRQPDSGKQTLYLAAGNSGGLLAFQDSLLKKPRILEKRNSFLFRRLRPGQKLLLVYTCQPGPGDYFGFRLLDASDKTQILDEVVLCSPDASARYLFCGYSGWIKFD